MLPDFFEFHNPTRVVFSPGIAEDFVIELESLKIKKLFIISDKVISSLGLVKKVTDGLESGGIEIMGEFVEVAQDAELDAINACTEQVKSSGAEGIVAIGGGSVIDTAKAVNILFSMGGNLIDDYSGAHTLTEPLKPLIAIPTTAGTGSEVTMIAVVYDKENKVKIPFTDKFLLPSLAVLDPEMTVTLPPKMTAATGMDALTHAIESYVGAQWSPFSDALAAGAVELIFNNLAEAVENGDNIEARGSILIASNMAGIAFTHSMVGCVHGMAHAVGGLFHVPHGIANAILLPHGMEYNFQEVKDKLAKLALFMGEDTSGLSTEEAALKSIEAVRKLTLKLHDLAGLPITLKETGVPEDALSEIAEAAVMDGTSFYNPREMVEDEILVSIKNAY